jgi:hypothetical protein
MKKKVIYVLIMLLAAIGACSQVQNPPAVSEALSPDRQITSFGFKGLESSVGINQGTGEIALVVRTTGCDEP